MNSIKTTATLLLTVFIISCESNSIKPSSNITFQDRTVESYSGIDVSDVFEVDVTFSDTEEKIEVEANENLHAYIDVVVVDSDVVIRLKSNTSIKGNSTLKAHITTANPIERISVNDVSYLKMNNELTAQYVDISVSDASQLSGKLGAAEGRLYVDDASSIYLEGYVDKLNLNASDASEVDGFELIVEDLVCNISDATRVSMTVQETLDLTAKGASTFSYKGEAVITNIDVGDASQVIKVD